jgi:putative transcriptional regulator
MRSTGHLAWWLGVSAAALVVWAVPAMAADPIAEGRMLIADRYMEDSNLAESVVFLVSYNRDGAMGLVLNRRTGVPLFRALKSLKEAAGHNEPVFFGGPVDGTGVLGLLRTADQPNGAKQVLSGVYLLASKELLQKTLAGNATPNTFRVYLGYAGWGPGQLESEVRQGAWKTINGSADKIFDRDPDTLWTRLIHEMEGQVVQWKPPFLDHVFNIELSSNMRGSRPEPPSRTGP